MTARTLCCKRSAATNLAVLDDVKEIARVALLDDHGTRRHGLVLHRIDEISQLSRPELSEEDVVPQRLHDQLARSIRLRDGAPGSGQFCVDGGLAEDDNICSSLLFQSSSNYPIGALLHCAWRFWCIKPNGELSFTPGSSILLKRRAGCSGRSFAAAAPHPQNCTS